MKEIKITKPTIEEIDRLGVNEWPIWEKEPSRFDWSYSQEETCYILEGKAKVETQNKTVEFGSGDMVTFPAGLDCVWEIEEPIRKHYKLA